MTDQPTNPSPPSVLPYVTVFITRDSGLERELLVLRPLTARPRLPDGTLGSDEHPEDAALRIAGAYCAVERLTLGTRLARLQQTLADHEYVILRPAMLRTAPIQDATMMRFTLERGMRVRMTATETDFVRVVYEEYALHENELAIATRRAGWVPTRSVTDQLEHHLFHLRSSDTVLNTLTTPRDPTAPQPVWIPLSGVSGLDYEHDAWLQRARPFLLREE